MVRSSSPRRAVWPSGGVSNRYALPPYRPTALPPYRPVVRGRVGQ
jgi:hypothetical protein